MFEVKGVQGLGVLGLGSSRFRMFEGEGNLG